MNEPSLVRFRSLMSLSGFCASGSLMRTLFVITPGRRSISTAAIAATAAGPNDPQVSTGAGGRPNTYEAARRCLLHLLAADAGRGRVDVTKPCHNADIVESLSAAVTVYVHMKAHV